MFNLRNPSQMQQLFNQKSHKWSIYCNNKAPIDDHKKCAKNGDDGFSAKNENKVATKWKRKVEAKMEIKWQKDSNLVATKWQ